MKFSLKLFLFLLFAMCSAKAQWLPANGVGGTVTCFASCPNGSGGTNIFAGTTNGVILSTDNGLTWASVNLGLTCMSVNALAVSKNGNNGYNIFAGTGLISASGPSLHVVSGGVFLSTNNGANWSDVGLDTVNVTSLAAYPNGLGECNLFAGAVWGSNYHLFSSFNSGTTWSSSSLDSVFVWSLSSYPNNTGGYNVYKGSGEIIPTGRTLAYLGGAYRSTDNGTTWNCLLSGYTNCIAVKDSDIYVGTIFGLYHSSDNGKNWAADSITLNGVPITGTRYNASITSISAIPGGEGKTLLFAGVSQGSYGVNYNVLIRSTDNGITWSCPLSWPASVSAIPNGTGGYNLFASGEKLLRSTDNGANWVTTNIGMSDANISFLSTVPNGMGGTDLLTSYYPNFLIRSTNDGATWMDVDTTGLASGFLNPSVGAFSSTPNNSGGVNYYIGCYGKTGNLFSSLPSLVKFYESTNNGSSWNPFASNDSNLFIYDNGLCMAAIQNKTGGYNLIESGLLGSNILHFSIDNGSTWQIPKAWVNASSFVLNDSITYAISGAIAFSTDGGINWTGVNNPGSIVSAFDAKGRYLLAGTESNGIFLSTDNGTTWNAINNGAMDSVVNNSEISSVDIIQDGNGGYKFLVGTCRSPQSFSTSNIYSHLFLSSDLGVTWSDVSAGLPQNGAITNFVVKSDISGTPYLYAGFGQPKYTSSTLPSYGVWRRPLSEIVVGVKEPLNQTPTRFSLEQNYPNPFNPSTTINYSLPKSSMVSIIVYDVLGREIETLVNKQESPGNYKITFNAGKLASGVYFYQLRSSNYISIKKMLLLK